MLSINTTSFISYADPSYLFPMVLSRFPLEVQQQKPATHKKFHRSTERRDFILISSHSTEHQFTGTKTVSLERDGLHGLRGVPVRVKDLTSAGVEQHKHQLHLPATAIRSSQHSKSQKSNKFVPVTVLGWHQVLHIVEKEICNFKKRRGKQNTVEITKLRL